MKRREGYTTIWVSVETYNELRSLRKHEGETMDSILRRLILKYRTGEELDQVIIWRKCYSKSRKMRTQLTLKKPKLSFY